MAKPKKGVVPPQFRKSTGKSGAKKSSARKMPAFLKKKLGRTGM